MKYIIVQPQDRRDNLGEPRAIVFPDCVADPPTHKDVARCHRVGHLVVVSAGFCSVSITPEGQGVPTFVVRVYGSSESLEMASRPEDAAIIEKLFTNQT